MRKKLGSAGGGKWLRRGVHRAGADSGAGTGHRWPQRSPRV